ncbi:MAG: CHAD domain-containing protein [Bacteroidales bacterium]|nr:CHAD domain-containing protein [Bacteroidales bacterium]
MNKKGNFQPEIIKTLHHYISVIEKKTMYFDENPDGSIHSIRKSIKKIRALLLLIKDEIGYSSYIREKNFYRNISNQLSELRNYEVYLSLSLNLEKMFIQELDYSCMTHLIYQIRKDKERSLDYLKIPGGFFGTLTQKLHMARLNIDKIKFIEDFSEVLKKGLKNSYGKARKALTLCINEQSENNLHSLRKALKNIWYQVRMIEQAYPVFLKAYSKSLKSATQILGEINDYAEFKSYFSLKEARGLNQTNRALIKTMIENLQNEKLALILPEVKLALIEKPSDFVKRIYGYWNISELVIQ